MQSWDEGGHRRDRHVNRELLHVGIVRMRQSTLAEAVKCVTENVADMMGEGKRGMRAPGRRADLAILGPEEFVEEIWLGIKCGRRNVEELST